LAGVGLSGGPMTNLLMSALQARSSGIGILSAGLRSLFARREMAAPPYRFVGIALAPNDRSVLHQRIEARFDAMLAAGFLDEVRALRAKYALTLDLPSMRCVGYRQAWEHLDGLSDAASFRDKGIAATRQLAKRQLTWQRKFVEDWGDLAVVPCDDDTVVDKTVDTARRLLAGT
nr:tRNA dimethylallyltransferase [Denitromonas sp.]